jgi:uncharacterized protein YegL
MAKKIKTVTTTVTTEEIIDAPSNEKTQIICILDRSGSMQEEGVIYEAINGFNNFLKEQKKLKDDATLTVALFDDRYEMLYDDVDIKKIKDITYDIWTPRGMTALYDAIGKTITTVKANRMRLGSEKPAKVLVCIVTDGKENASHEYHRDGIKKLIKECENENWNFIYLAANQDAFAVGGAFGVSFGNTYTFAGTAQGAAFMSSTLNNATTNYRSMSTNSAGFSKKSKSLINEPDKDKKEPDENKDLTENNGTITITGTDGTGITTTNVNNTTTTKK